MALKNIRHKLAYFMVVIGSVAVLAGAWGAAHKDRGNKYYDAPATVVEINNATTAAGAFMPTPVDGHKTVLAARSVLIVEYTHINKQKQRGTLLAFDDHAPKTGEQITISYDAGHPQIVFRRRGQNVPVYMMLMGAVFLIAGGLIIRRLRLSAV